MAGGLNPTMGMINHLVICHSMRLQTGRLSGMGAFHPLSPVQVPCLIQRYCSNQTRLRSARSGWPKQGAGVLNHSYIYNYIYMSETDRRVLHNPADKISSHKPPCAHGGHGAHGAHEDQAGRRPAGRPAAAAAGRGLRPWAAGRLCNSIWWPT